MASKAPSAAEEEAIIKNRFLTGAAVSRGEPPFRKLVRRFVELVEKVESGTSDAADEAFKLFLRETTNIEYQAQKYAAIGIAQTKEQDSYVRKQLQLHEHIEQAKQDIEDKKLELQQARIERQHMEEYELLRGMISELPTRAGTQAEIDRINKQMERIRDKGIRNTAAMERKRKQYALLFHVLEELQRVSDDVEDPQQQQQQQQSGQHDQSHKQAAMDVDG